MITTEQWNWYNELGILDIFEFYDQEPRIERTGKDTIVVTYYYQGDTDREAGVYQRTLRLDEVGWYNDGESLL